MKNVMGKEIFSSQKEKEDFYNNLYRNQNEGLQRSFLERNSIKDKVISEEIIPFCLEQKVESVLDIGSRDGKYPAMFYDAGIKDATATEITTERLDVVKNILISNGYFNIKYLCKDIENSTIENYGLIILSDLLEHLEKPLNTWKNCLQHSRFCYGLVPKEDSWNWSPDHVTRFDEELILKFLSFSKEVITFKTVNYDAANSWFSFLVKGYI